MKSFALTSTCEGAMPTEAWALALAEQQAVLAKWYQLEPLPVSFSPDPGALPADEEITVVQIVDQIPDAPGDLAYHTVDPAGRPLCLIGWGAVKASGGTLTGPEGLLPAISHELCECRVNPDCLRFSPLSATSWIPFEVCDPVQGSDYDSGGGLFLANFVGPRWFSREQVGPYDFRGACSDPLRVLPGGYLAVTVGGPNGTTTNVFGERCPAHVRARVERQGPRGGALWSARPR